jgi:DNA/RNA endonuclease G (NUC1)
MKKSLTLLLLIPIFSIAQNSITVKHRYYTLEYDTVLKAPLISWYVQTKKHATSTVKINRKTTATFHHDPLIPARYQVANDNAYKLFNKQHDRFNGRDKGHLSPFTAFNFDSTAARESMYYTNTAPQYPYFNEHPWEELEMYVLKTLAPMYDSIYVYTGCLYGDSTMGNVPQPDYYWKVIYYNKKYECWIARNEFTIVTDYTKYAVEIKDLKKTILFYYPKLKLEF